jgi:hypothetical protein
MLIGIFVFCQYYFQSTAYPIAVDNSEDLHVFDTRKEIIYSVISGRKVIAVNLTDGEKWEMKPHPKN